MKYTTIKKTFFEEDTITVAQKLLGTYIGYTTETGEELIGKIVETEAYLANDPASHSFKKKTPRNEAMFGTAGTAYVYFTYGMHFCFNVVTEKEGIGEAVLIRAVEPLQGIKTMKENRRKETDTGLTNGPAKFTQAFNIQKEHNKTNLLSEESPLRLMKGTKEPFETITTTRIGIREGTQRPLRFYIKGNKHVSKT